MLTKNFLFKYILIFEVMISVSAGKLAAQSFTDINAGLVPMWNSALAWGDYDKDGDLDLIIAGYIDGAGNSNTILYRNNGGAFVQSGLSFAGFGAADLKWVDFDRDGYLDLIISGNTKIGGNNVPRTYIYQNQGGVSFQLIQPNIPGVVAGKISIADFDNDGDADVAICGSGFSNIYRNDGNWTFVATNQITDAVSNGSIHFADMNNDGWMDVFITGNLGSFTYIAKVYVNDGSGNFTQQPTSVVPVRYADSRFADMDNDGDLDLIVSGVWRDGNRDSVRTNVYLNHNLTFTSIPHYFTGHKNPWISIGDYDNNGWIDFITSGDTLPTTAVTPLTVIHHNQNGLQFRDTLNPIIGLRLASVAWGDYDNDGDLDLAIAGYLSSGQYRSRIYRNNINRVNTVPQYPSGLNAAVYTDSVVLSWNRAQDNETPSLSLSYNIYLHNLTYGITYIQPAADRTTGYLHTPGYGICELDTHKIIRRLMNGQYEWSVQSIDPGWKGSLFSPLTGFTITGSAVNTPPYRMAALPDTALDEDFGDVFLYRLTDYLADSTGMLSFTAHCQPAHLQVFISQDSLVLRSAAEINGLYHIVIQATDGEYSVSDTFTVRVRPVNDPPLAAYLLFPQHQDTLYYLPDTLMFIWNQSRDPDTQTVFYEWQIVGPGLDTVISGLSDTLLVFLNPQWLQPHSRYDWTVRVTDLFITIPSPDTFALFTGDLISVPLKESGVPVVFDLHPNFPNPFNPATTIRYDLPVAGKVGMKIYNALGQPIRTLVNIHQPAGSYSVVWDGNDDQGRSVASGVYICRLETQGATKVRKMLLLR